MHHSRLEGDDIMLRVSLPFLTALLGGSVTVDVFGEETKLQITRTIKEGDVRDCGVFKSARSAGVW